MSTARAKEILADLLAFPTVSSESNLEIIDYIKRLLEPTGGRIVLHHDDTRQKANLYAILGPGTPGGVLLSGHTDVVPVADQDWTVDPFAMTQADGRLYGRGSCDMKGFLAAVLAMVEELPVNGLRQPLHLAFTYDEEVGCFGAQALVEALRSEGIAPAIAIVGEPTEMRIIEGHKACCEYTARFQGVEGHGSTPEQGVNAAEYAARYVVKLLELRKELRLRSPQGSRFDPPWTTLNIGHLSGGVATNVIPGKAEVSWEMRPVVPEDEVYVKAELDTFLDDMRAEMRAFHPAAGVETEIVAEIDGLHPTETNAARDLVAQLTGANDTELVPFGTEAGLFQSLGTDVVVCGPGSIAQAHKPNEYLDEAQLAQCCAMLERLAKRMC